jgi:hypothetical protein
MDNRALNTLIVVLLSFLAFLGFEWARDNFVPSPTPLAVPPDAPIQHVGYEMLAHQAVGKFSDLAPEEQRAMRASLALSLIPVDDWIERVGEADLQFLCLGERHLDETRRFLADRIFSKLRAELLLLEVSEQGLRDIGKQLDSGRTRITLLDADIASIIRAARRRNGAVLIAGIDESRAQWARRHGSGAGSREKSIVQNYRRHARPDGLHVALFGALHCSDQPNWLFDTLRYSGLGLSPQRLANVNVLGDHEDGSVEAFVYFLRKIGLSVGDFAIAETRTLHPLVYQWFSPLTRTFGYYRSVIVYST